MKKVARLFCGTGRASQLIWHNQLWQVNPPRTLINIFYRNIIIKYILTSNTAGRDFIWFSNVIGSECENCFPKLITFIVFVIAHHCALKFKIAVCCIVFTKPILFGDITHALVDLRERDCRRWFVSEWRRMNTICSFIRIWPLSITSAACRGKTRWE